MNWENIQIWFMVLVIFGGIFCMAYWHELAHYEIYRQYGIDSDIYTISAFPNFATVPVADADLDNCDGNCILAHNLNEVFGYQMYIAFGFVMFMMFMIWLEVKK